MANSELNGTANILEKGREGRNIYICSLCSEKLKIQGHETHLMVISTALLLVEDKRGWAQAPEAGGALCAHCLHIPALLPVPGLLGFVWFYAADVVRCTFH